jgi:hypothetical protein
MSTVNEINPKIDQTVRIYDQFYNYSANVPAMEYDAVLSYFKSVFKTAYAAENFTTTVFRVAQETNQNAITLLQQFESTSGTEPDINILMAYYLNSIRSPSTLFGVLAPTTPNFYTARNVRQ